MRFRSVETAFKHIGFTFHSVGMTFELVLMRFDSVGMAFKHVEFIVHSVGITFKLVSAEIFAFRREIQGFRPKSLYLSFNFLLMSKLNPQRFP
jgi:hypothetical protein